MVLCCMMLMNQLFEVLMAAGWQIKFLNLFQMSRLIYICSSVSFVDILDLLVFHLIKLIVC